MPGKNFEKKKDRLWSFIIYGAEQHIVRNLKAAEDEQLNGIPKNQWAAVREQNRKQRIKDGLPYKIESSKDVERNETFLSEDIQKMLIGKGSVEEYEEAMVVFGELLAKIYVEKGKQLEINRGRIGKSESYKDEKAFLITERSYEAKGTHMEETLNNIKQQILSNVDTFHGTDEAEKCKAIFQDALVNAGKKLPDGDKEYFDNYYNEKISYEDRSNKKKLPKELEAYEEKAGKAYQIAQKYAREDMIRAHKELTAELTPSVRMSVNQFDRKSVDTVFMRGIVKDLESTGTGADEKRWYEKLGKWHKENSKTYDDMLKNIKTYISMVEANEDGKKVLIVQNKMIGSIKKYIEGKETVRSHQFGQKRFDDVIHLLSQVMPSQNFDREIIEPINNARHKAGDYYHDLSADAYEADKKYPGPDSEYGRLRRLGLEGMDEIQKKTQEYVTHMPDKFKERWMENVLAATLSQNPEKTGEMVEQFVQNGDNFSNVFKPIEDKFKAIGQYTREDSLSDKDFIAVAYLGADTHVEYLTSKKSNKHPVGKYAEKIEEGRQKAAEALRQYEAGNKEPLAKLFAEGIKRVTKDYQNAMGLQNNLIAKSEMMMRAMNMMQRDPELMRLATDKKIGGLSKTDLANMRGVMRGAEVITRAADANEKIHQYQIGKLKLSKEEAVKAYTDLETYNVMNYNMMAMHTDPTKYRGNKAFDQENLFMASNKFNLGKALGSDKDMKEFRANIKDIVVKKKMINYTTKDVKEHSKDFTALDEAVGQIGKKMPQTASVAKPKKVQKTTQKKQENVMK